MDKVKSGETEIACKRAEITRHAYSTYFPNKKWVKKLARLTEKYEEMKSCN